MEDAVAATNAISIQQAVRGMLAETEASAKATITIADALQAAAFESRRKANVLQAIAREAKVKADETKSKKDKLKADKAESKADKAKDQAAKEEAEALKIKTVEKLTFKDQEKPKPLGMPKSNPFGSFEKKEDEKPKAKVPEFDLMDADPKKFAKSALMELAKAFSIEKDVKGTSTEQVLNNLIARKSRGINDNLAFLSKIDKRDQADFITEKMKEDIPSAF